VLTCNDMLILSAGMFVTGAMLMLLVRRQHSLVAD
jgi:hypothetical protein